MKIAAQITVAATSIQTELSERRASTSRTVGPPRTIVAWTTLLLALNTLIYSQSEASGRSNSRSRLVVVYQEPKNPRYVNWKQSLESQRFLQKEASELSQAFQLPADIPVILSECGQTNAFYKPDKRRIVICYELADQVMKIFANHLGLVHDTAEPGGDTPPRATPDIIVKESGDSPETTWGKAVYGALAFIFYHELGHAFIDLYGLPVTGREEDAVDQMAAVLLIAKSSRGPSQALNAAIFFAKLDQAEYGTLAFADEHSLGPQRFFDLMCWVYGANPTHWRPMIELGALTSERANRCPGEFKKYAASWNTLLTPHLRRAPPSQLSEGDTPAATQVSVMATTGNDENDTLNNLGSLRMTIAMAYGDAEGVYPRDLSALVRKKYLSEIPMASTGHHEPSNVVANICGAVEHPERLTDTGGWAYCSDLKDPDAGTIIVNCTHRDSKGKGWPSY